MCWVFVHVYCTQLVHIWSTGLFDFEKRFFKEIWVNELGIAARYFHNFVDGLLRRDIVHPDSLTLVQVAFVLSLFGVLTAMQFLFYF